LNHARVGAEGRSTDRLLIAACTNEKQNH
jgi:hypothetical protein